MARSRNPRRGLQRLSCGCGASVWQTWAAVERGPRPVCGACDARFVPDDPELASAVCDAAELESHPWLKVYVQEASSILHGQAPNIQANRVTAEGKAWAFADPAREAAERVRREMREAAKSSQLSGLRRPAVDPMPF